MHPSHSLILSLTLFEIMSPNLPNICAGVGSVGSVMSKFVRPSDPIRDKYHNWLNKYKLQGVILLEEDVKVVRQDAGAIPVFVFTHAILPRQQFYSAKQYIHLNQEGT